MSSVVSIGLAVSEDQTYRNHGLHLANSVFDTIKLHKNIYEVMRVCNPDFITGRIPEGLTAERAG